MKDDQQEINPSVPDYRLPEWPKAYPDTQSSADFKVQLADFRVVELPQQAPLGEGEHVWLEVEKQGANTAWVAQQLADFAGVGVKDVGYAGLKDRHGITRQWFSLYLPRIQEPDFTQLNNDEFQVLQQSRSAKKLRRGDLIGNHFVIRLRRVVGDQALINANLEQIAQHGTPNYFGPQRFGHDGQNIEQGRAMLAREIRVRNRTKKGLYLSSIRSFVFNQVLAARVEQGSWYRAIAGDCLTEEGYPTGPMWGRGRSSAAELAETFESTVVQNFQLLCGGMEHAGLSQERRSLVTMPEGLSWRWLKSDDCADSSGDKTTNDDLEISFMLPAGHYATSLLCEVITLKEPQRRDSDALDASK